MTESTLNVARTPMEIEDLNRRLATLSPSEESYRAGRPFDWGQNELIEIEPGHTVMLFESDLFAERARAFAGMGRRATPLGSELLIRQHSRYNPMPEHVHSYVEISYVYRGTCPQRVNGEGLVVRENQVLLLDSGCPHSIASLEESDIMISVCMEKSFLDRCLEEACEGQDWLTDYLLNSLNDRTNSDRYILFHSQRSRRVRRFFQELLCEYFDPSPHADRIILRLFQIVISDLMNVYEDDFVRREEQQRGSRVSVVSLVRHIQDHYLTCTLDSLAESFFISRNYASSLLKKETGKTYLQLVQEQKLAHAANLLRTGTCTVEEAAHAVGYQNMTFFYRKFEQQYGVAPATLRP